MKSSNWTVFIVTLAISKSCQSSTNEGIVPGFVSYHLSVIYIELKKI